ncbi:MAG TPA: hypothetical protein PK186_10095 [candidate division Zixibacteria bacterium]|nr:hypothetical protein [candidate division Zixibacteria bacterium]MDD4916654.1 hypothetical protein [candidate division Zixibacteria bacterium]MDM7973212.1 hypothetical protein [candidate division Zixibacteria bacterium]HOD66004.1 hypothetical protein [candidate division Zixibacteria bacterium]HPM37894.1 hypothetical protein [candidate division Zixibacteria bacterium]
MTPTHFPKLAAALTLASLAAYILIPSSASARYHDHSDELPGTDTPVGTYLAVAAGALAVVGIIALVKHSGGKDKDVVPADSSSTGREEPAEETEGEGDAAGQSSGGESAVSDDAGASRLGLYLGLNPAETIGSDGRRPDFSDLGVKVGFTLSF